MGLEDSLDLGGRDVLAAADDRVGLAPGDAQPAVLVEDAEVAGVQPAIAGERAGRDGRPGDEDLPLLPGAQRLLRVRRRSTITRVQNSGGPALGGWVEPSSSAATGVVVTCEQASVSP